MRNWKVRSEELFCARLFLVLYLFVLQGFLPGAGRECEGDTQRGKEAAPLRFAAPFPFRFFQVYALHIRRASLFLIPFPLVVLPSLSGCFFVGAAVEKQTKGSHFAAGEL